MQWNVRMSCPRWFKSWPCHPVVAHFKGSLNDPKKVTSRICQVYNGWICESDDELETNSLLPTFKKKNGLSKIHPAVCPTIKPPSTWLPLSLQKTPGSMVVFYGVALQPGFGFGCRCFLTSSVQEKKHPNWNFSDKKIPIPSQFCEKVTLF